MIIEENKYTPVGIVQIRDEETDELVYETHNAIVESGRKLILNAIFGNSALSPTKFKKYYETNNEVLTSPDMTYANISDNIYYPATPAIATASGDNLTYTTTTVSMPIGGYKAEVNEYSLLSGVSNKTTGIIYKVKNNETISGTVYSSGYYKSVNNGESWTVVRQDEYRVYTDTVQADNGICMELHFNLQNTEDVLAPVTAIGLLYSDGDTNTLFSRAAIDPVFMRPGRRYVCHYTLYF